jgi:hypothetical protein
MRRFVPLALFVFGLGCTDSHGACDLDSDCPVDEICDEHACVAVSGPCTSDAECREGMLCRDGRCGPLTCRDTDGDHYRVGPECPTTETLDCDDTAPYVNPGAVEVCGDGVDNNCVGGDDEGCVGCVPAMDRPCGRGICAGTQRCDELGWQECLPLVTPELEICGNGLDDDCDGEIDDGCTCGCASDADCPDGATCDGCVCLP